MGLGTAGLEGLRRDSAEYPRPPGLRDSAADGVRCSDWELFCGETAMGSGCDRLCSNTLESCFFCAVCLGSGGAGELNVSGGISSEVSGNLSAMSDLAASAFGSCEGGMLRCGVLALLICGPMANRGGGATYWARLAMWLWRADATSPAFLDGGFSDVLLGASALGGSTPLLMSRL